jgi:hypothetical protein
MPNALKGSTANLEKAIASDQLNAKIRRRPSVAEVEEKGIFSEAAAE